MLDAQRESDGPRSLVEESKTWTVFDDEYAECLLDSNKATVPAEAVIKAIDELHKRITLLREENERLRKDVAAYEWDLLL